MKPYFILSIFALIACQAQTVTIPHQNKIPENQTQLALTPTAPLSNPSKLTPQTEFAPTPSPGPQTSDRPPLESSKTQAMAVPCLLLNNPCQVSTLSGDGKLGFSGDGQLAHKARYRNPSHMAVDDQGNIYIADTDNHRIRRIDHQTGQVSTAAGNGIAGFSGDGKNALLASLNQPTGLALDRKGHLYFSDSKNHRVRYVNMATGNIHTLVGDGFQGYTGDEIPPLKASLNNPQGLAFDENNTLYIADRNNHRIRRVDVDADSIDTLAGSGIEGFSGDEGPAEKAQLRFPSELAVGQGRVFVSDVGNHRIREIDLQDNTMHTALGSGTPGFNGDTHSAEDIQLNEPRGLTLWNKTYLFVADKNNHKIRRYNLSTREVNTFAGIGSAGYSGDQKSALNAEFKWPSDLLTTPSQNLVVLDRGNQRIRQLVGH